MYQYIATPENDNFKPQYRFLDGATASGKSSVVCSHIRKFIGYRNQIIVCEKVALLEEWGAKLKAKGVKCDLIAGDGAVRDVSDWFNSHNTLIGTGVLLCTQAAIFGIGRISMKHECDVFFDELPPVRNVIADKFHTCASVLNEQLQLGNSIAKFKSDTIIDGKRKQGVSDSLNNVVPVNRKNLKKYLKESANILTKSQNDLFKYVLSQNHDVYVKKLAFDKLGKVKSNRDCSNKGETTFVSMLNSKAFDGWGSCTVISSDYQLSMFKHWIGDRLDFKRDEFLYCRLNNRGHHPDSWLERTNFNYLIHPDEKAGLNSMFWLKKNRFENGEKLDCRLNSVIGNENLLLCTNVSRSKRKLAMRTGVTVLTSKDLGVNEYSDRNTVVFDAALNERPEAESIMKLLGIDLETMRLDSLFNCAYQVASRCNLRTNEPTNRTGADVNLYFADKPTCFYVMSRFANRNRQVAKVRYVGDDSYQAVNVAPVMSDVVYSNRFKSRLRKRIRRFGGGNSGFLHQLEQSILEPSVASREAPILSAGVGSDTGASLGATSSFEVMKGVSTRTGNIELGATILPQNAPYFDTGENRTTYYKSVTYGKMVNFNKEHLYKPLHNELSKLTISDLPTKVDWLAFSTVDEFGVQNYQKSKVRQFINKVLKNQLVQPICSTITSDRFLYSNFAILEFSTEQCSRVEFVNTFSPLYSDIKNRRVSFLISEDKGIIQVIVFIKSHVESWTECKEKLADIESKLGFKLDVDQNRYYRLQEGFEGFNCARSRDIQRHGL